MGFLKGIPPLLVVATSRADAVSIIGLGRLPRNISFFSGWGGGGSGRYKRILGGVAMGNDI